MSEGNSVVFKHIHSSWHARSHSQLISYPSTNYHTDFYLSWMFTIACVFDWHIYICGIRVLPRPLLSEKPDVVVSTPSRLLSHLRAGNLCLKNTLDMVVIDEADLVFSFGYESDLKAIMGWDSRVVCWIHSLETSRSRSNRALASLKWLEVCSLSELDALAASVHLFCVELVI